MKKATDKAVQILAEMSQPVAGKEQIAKVAAVSSGSEEVGQMVADAMEKFPKTALSPSRSPRPCRTSWSW